ncbi:hypothetical protein AADEFJLK_02696 [Methylovulum psychrotolerans]|uniref:Uncharacterized protein n=1 Tax=Methylovulum psychrotolerans TaxID=1704499 RepID=A0A2S5CKA5_9GAMM|nr:hypothetical protein AADEFJLK_02696 [Methylovulum psychrotolerans]
MPAQFKKVVIAAHLLQMQQLLPKLGNDGFARALRGLVSAGGDTAAIWGGQGLTGQLAVGGERELFQHDKSTGQHVVGQVSGQLLA